MNGETKKIFERLIAVGFMCEECKSYIVDFIEKYENGKPTYDEEPTNILEPLKRLQMDVLMDILSVEDDIEKVTQLARMNINLAIEKRHGDTVRPLWFSPDDKWMTNEMYHDEPFLSNALQVIKEYKLNLIQVLKGTSVPPILYAQFIRETRRKINPIKKRRYCKRLIIECPDGTEKEFCQEEIKRRSKNIKPYYTPDNMLKLFADEIPDDVIKILSISGFSNGHKCTLHLSERRKKGSTNEPPPKIGLIEKIKDYSKRLVGAE